MKTTIYSFGYKMNGEDQFATTGPFAPLVIDCRSLVNPYLIPHLRSKSGLDQEVQDCMLKNRMGRLLLSQGISHAQWTDPATVAFGCSYGKHRSVALAELAAKFLRGVDMDVQVIHTGAVTKKIGLVVR